MNQDTRDDDARLLAEIDRHYRPAPETADERVAFQRQLDARRSSPRRSLTVLAGAAAVVAALAVLVVLPGGGPDEPIPGDVSIAGSGALAADAWQESLLLGDDEIGSDEEALPDEYEVIASLFLDG